MTQTAKYDQAALEYEYLIHQMPQINGMKNVYVPNLIFPSDPNNFPQTAVAKNAILKLHELYSIHAKDKVQAQKVQLLIKQHYPDLEKQIQTAKN